MTGMTGIFQGPGHIVKILAGFRVPITFSQFFIPIASLKPPCQRCLWWVSFFISLTGTQNPDCANLGQGDLVLWSYFFFFRKSPWSRKEIVHCPLFL